MSSNTNQLKIEGYDENQKMFLVNSLRQHREGSRYLRRNVRICGQEES
jgi:hypothetical protein